MRNSLSKRAREKVPYYATKENGKEMLFFFAENAKGKHKIVYYRALKRFEKEQKKREV